MALVVSTALADEPEARDERVGNALATDLHRVLQEVLGKVGSHSASLAHAGILTSVMMSVNTVVSIVVKISRASVGTASPDAAPVVRDGDLRRAEQPMLSLLGLELAAHGASSGAERVAYSYPRRSQRNARERTSGSSTSHSIQPRPANRRCGRTPGVASARA